MLVVNTKEIFWQILHQNGLHFPAERNAFVFDPQHGRRDVTCKPAIPAIWRANNTENVLSQQSESFNNNDSDGYENVTKQQVLISKTMPYTRVLHFGTFLCRSLQNNNVKWPNSKFYGEREHTTANSLLSIWTWPPSLQIQLLDSSATLDNVN